MKILHTCYFWLVGGVFFLGFLLATFFLSWVIPLRRLDPFLKFMLRSFFVPLFLKIKLTGSEHLDNDRTYLYMVNHISILDIPLIGGYVPGYLRGLEASRQHKWPLYGHVMRRLGNIPIERNNINASLSAIELTRKSLEKGISMVIFPEGGRTETGELKRFKKLPFHLAKKAGVDVVPIGISGMFERNNKNAFSYSPGEIILNIGEPITASRISEMESLDLRTLVFQEVKKLSKR